MTSEQTLWFLNLWWVRRYSFLDRFNWILNECVTFRDPESPKLILTRAKLRTTRSDLFTVGVTQSHVCVCVLKSPQMKCYNNTPDSIHDIQETFTTEYPLCSVTIIKMSKFRLCNFLFLNYRVHLEKWLLRGTFTLMTEGLFMAWKIKLYVTNPEKWDGTKTVNYLEVIPKSFSSVQEIRVVYVVTEKKTEEDKKEKEQERSQRGKGREERVKTKEKTKTEGKGPRDTGIYWVYNFCLHWNPPVVSFGDHTVYSFSSRSPSVPNGSRWGGPPPSVLVSIEDVVTRTVSRRPPVEDGRNRCGTGLPSVVRNYRGRHKSFICPSLVKKWALTL